MAAVVTIARGHDASYPFKRIGAAEGPVTGQCGAGYYLSAVEKCGEAAGTRWFRFEWAYRPASMRRVIAGPSEKAIAPFSSRRTQITNTTPADQHEKERGLAPGQRVSASVGRFANAMTRRAKGPGALDFIALLRGWEWASRVAEPETLRDLARTMRHATPRARAPTDARADTRAELSRRAGRLAPRGELTQTQERTVMAAGLARAQGSRAGRCAARRRPRATTDADTRGAAGD